MPRFPGHFLDKCFNLDFAARTSWILREVWWWRQFDLESNGFSYKTARFASFIRSCKKWIVSTVGDTGCWIHLQSFCYNTGRSWGVVSLLKGFLIRDLCTIQSRQRCKQTLIRSQGTSQFYNVFMTAVATGDLLMIVNLGIRIKVLSSSPYEYNWMGQNNLGRNT